MVGLAANNTKNKRKKSHIIGSSGRDRAREPSCNDICTESGMQHRSIHQAARQLMTIVTAYNSAKGTRKKLYDPVNRKKPMPRNKRLR
jgi:hypothetical protein